MATRTARRSAPKKPRAKARTHPGSSKRTDARDVEQERFVRSCDGTELYATTIGAGPPLVLCDGLGCDGFVWKYLVPAFKGRHQIVHWHYRGHGLSESPHNPSAVAVSDLCGDLMAILDAFGLERPVLLGHSMGVQVILELELQHPERVAGLVPMCGSYGRPLDTLHGSDVAGSFFPHLFHLTRRFPLPIQKIWSTVLGTELAYQIGSHFELNPDLVQRGDFEPYFTHLASMDVRVFMRMLEQLSRHSVEDRLHRVQAPALVVAGELDRFTPAWLSQRMQQLIPNADLLMVPGGTHGAPIEIPELVHLRLERFLNERAWPKERAPRTRRRAASKEKPAPSSAPKDGTPRKTRRKSAKGGTGRAGVH